MIDDMEDGDDSILPVHGRRGSWFILNDGTAGAQQAPTGTPFTMSAIAGGRGASLYAARTSGQGFKSWSPLFGFWLNKLPAGLKQPYDASPYAGITFWAKSDTSQLVRVQLPDKDTDPDGQVCVGAGTGGCSDHFGKTIVVTPQWVKYTVLFSQLSQAGWGRKAASFDPSTAYGIEFQFQLLAAFDCWIDDIAFLTP